ncbi:MAG: thermonuclease family protein [Candidatus Aminicenantes bacterium]|jgi:endonuclease YncB( thermonuclease family)
MKENLKLKNIVFIVVLVIAAAGLSGAAFTGWGYKALDGDSITVAISTEKIISIELDGIDCPEPEQDFGKEAQDFTKNFIYKKKVKVEIIAYEAKDRVIGRVFLEDKDLSLALIEAGLAWYDKKNSSDKKLAKAQKKAKKAKKGLWSTDKPTPPWIFRASHKKSEKP